MALYAISDLHLSLYKEKPMDIFDPIWLNHSQKLLENWNNIVQENDTVIVNGDLSWGMNITEVLPDLEFIKNLNGRKILIQGNHDFFWNSTSKLNSMYDNMFFLKNNFAIYNDIAICGTRGWLCPGDTRYTPHDNKIYLREIGRLNLSIQSAIKNGYENKILIAMHYPPTNDKFEESEFIKIFKQYNIKQVIYGHLHGVNKYKNSLLGVQDGIKYNLVSSDYLNFKPIKLI